MKITRPTVKMDRFSQQDQEEMIKDSKSTNFGASAAGVRIGPAVYFWIGRDMRVKLHTFGIVWSGDTVIKSVVLRVKLSQIVN